MPARSNQEKPPGRRFISDMDTVSSSTDIDPVTSSGDIDPVTSSGDIDPAIS